MKRNVLGILAVTSLLLLAGCNGGGETSTSDKGGSNKPDTPATSTYKDYSEPNHSKPTPIATNGGKVLNIRCWNNEFEGRFENYYPGATKVSDNTYTIPSKSGTGTVTVKFNITPNDNNGYQNALDAALSKSNPAADDKVDMFLMEADYALKYANSDYSLDVHDLGLTDTDLSDMYDYTKVIASDTRPGMNKALKGVSWQAAPGLYAYRNDIAKQLWSDYPADPEATDTAAVKAQKTKAQSEFVQAKLADWTKFDAVAAEAKAKGYYMLSGYDDSYRTFSNNATTSWVKKYVEDEDGVKTSMVTLDPQIKTWIKQTKNYTEKGYSHKTSLWDGDWAKDQGPTGKVFGFFYSTWGINFTLLGNSLATPTDKGGKEELGNGLYGQYRVCQGPASYYWGGTWIVGAQGTDNKAEVADIMKQLTCTKAIDKKITVDTQDYTNNKTAMHELATDTNFGSSFLGGQNHIALFEESAKKIKMAAMSPIDQTCNEGIQKAMKDYFAGTVDYKTAIKNFKATVKSKVPAVVFDETFDAAL